MNDNRRDSDEIEEIAVEFGEVLIFASILSAIVGALFGAALTVLAIHYFGWSIR